LKKNTLKQKRWHLIRAWNQFRRTHGKNPIGAYALEKRRYNYSTSYVKIWQGGVQEQAVCTGNIRTAPANLCFEKNPIGTTDFFNRVRNNFNISVRRGQTGFVTRRSDRAMPRISGYSDFSKIKRISMAAAIVLSADYDRLKHYLKEVPPTINLHEWKPIVVTRLHQLGFFNLLGHEPEDAMLMQSGDFLLMRILKSQNSNDLNIVDHSLGQLRDFMRSGQNEQNSEFDKKITHILTIISEVMSNVTQHAYPEKYEFDYDHIDSFWISAEADKSDKTLRVVMFDQGATIPCTYPRLSRTGKVRKYLRRALKSPDEFDYRDDGTYIRAALRYGGSRTDENYRGKGFPQMNELLDNLGGGELKIRSRYGWCERDCNGKVTSGSLQYSIGGTLVEWKIEL